MTTTRIEKKSCIGGGFNSYEVTETDLWKGEQLGTELTEAHVLRTRDCDHYENEDGEGIELDRGVWVKKSLVKSVCWQKDSFGASVLSRVTYARPL